MGEVPSLAAIALVLAMSERSIQRSLCEESTSYRRSSMKFARDWRCPICHGPAPRPLMWPSCSGSRNPARSRGLFVAGLLDWRISLAVQVCLRTRLAMHGSDRPL